MQASDILLDWARYESEETGTSDVYFHQLWDGKGSVSIDEMGPRRLKNYAAHCGAALTLAHARTGDAATISGYLGDDRTADDVFADFAARYADLNETDHAAQGPPSPAAGLRPSTASEFAGSARRGVRCDREAASSS